MDRIFVKDQDTAEDIANSLFALLSVRGYMPANIPVLRIAEGEDLDLDTRVFGDTAEIGQFIVDSLEASDVFTQVMTMLDNEEELVYLLFTTHNDAELPEFLTMAVQGNA